MKVKVCGNSTLENLKEIIKTNPDFLGFIFWPVSKRKVLDKSIISIVPKEIKTVGVVVDQSLEEIKNIPTEFIQLHGQEDAKFCQEVKKMGFKVIKAFQIKEDFDFKILNAYQDYVDYFLFDAFGKLPGGNSTKFNHQKLEDYNLEVPFFLAGGIDLENANDVLALKSRFKNLFCVDINSKFEILPGIKDASKVEAFINTIKNN